MWDFLDWIGGGLSDLGGRAASWLSEGLSSVPSKLLSADVLLPAAIAGGGMYLQNRAVKDAQKQQNAITERGLAEQQAMQQPVAQAINQQAFDYSAPQVQDETDRIRVRLAGNLDDYIGAARESFPEEARTGRVSSDYTTGMSSMRAGEDDRRSRLNAAWANLMAPGQQQFEQGMRDTGYGTTVANANADAGVLANANALEAAKVQPSGSKMLIGDLMKGAGSGMAMSSLLRPKPSTRAASWMRGGSYNPEN